MLVGERLSDATAVAGHVIEICPDGRRDELIALAHVLINRRNGQDPGRAAVRAGRPAPLRRPAEFGSAPQPRVDAMPSTLRESSPVDLSFLKAWFLCWDVLHGETADPTHGAVHFRHHRETVPLSEHHVATALIGRYLFYR